MFKTKRLFISVLVLIFLFSVNTPMFVNATDNPCSLEEITVTLQNGEVRTYQIEQFCDKTVISGYDTSGNLIERSTIEESKIIQVISNGSADGLEYNFSSDPIDVFAVAESHLYSDDTSTRIDFAKQSDGLLSLSNSSNLWYEPDPMSNAGLTASTLYPGYMYLGETGPDSIWQVTVAVHRKMVYLGASDSYRFSVSPGTTISTLASILASVVTGTTLPLAIAIGLATAFLGTAVDVYSGGRVEFVKYHYIYNFNCNHSAQSTYRCCECREYWCIYDGEGNKLGYESKNLMADNHITVSIIQKCPMVRQDYLEGIQSDVVCSLPQ